MKKTWLLDPVKSFFYETEINRDNFGSPLVPFFCFYTFCFSHLFVFIFFVQKKCGKCLFIYHAFLTKQENKIFFCFFATIKGEKNNGKSAIKLLQRGGHCTFFYSPQALCGHLILSCLGLFINYNDADFFRCFLIFRKLYKSSLEES